MLSKKRTLSKARLAPSEKLVPFFFFFFFFFFDFEVLKPSQQGHIEPGSVNLLTFFLGQVWSSKQLTNAHTFASN